MRQSCPIKRIDTVAGVRCPGKKVLALRDFSVIVNYNTSSPRSSAAAGSQEMRTRLAQYGSDIVSLAVMALMSIALVAGQASAVHQVVDEPVPHADKQIITRK